MVLDEIPCWRYLDQKKNVFFVNYCYTKLTLIGHHGIVWNFNPVDVILLSNFWPLWLVTYDSAPFVFAQFHSFFCHNLNQHFCGFHSHDQWFPAVVYVVFFKIVPTTGLTIPLFPLLYIIYPYSCWAWGRFKSPFQMCYAPYSIFTCLQHFIKLRVQDASSQHAQRTLNKI